MPVTNVQPIHPGELLTATLRLATANTDHTGGGTLTTLLTARTTANQGKGAVVARVQARWSAAAGASTAMVLRLWRVAAGGTITLEDEVAMATATASTTAVGASATFTRTNIILAPGEALKVTQTVSENVDYSAEYGEY